MKKSRAFLRLSLLAAFCGVGILSCNDGKKSNETILEGKIDIYVDQTVSGIAEDQVMIFESQYKAKLNQVNKTEAEIVNLLQNGKIGVAVLTRTLSDKETKIFKNRSIKPRITAFAKDAVAFISNKSTNDTIIDLQQVIDFMNGRPSSVKGLVFDNANSGTKRYIDSISGYPKVNNSAVYSLKSHLDVLKYVSDNKGVIGVTGLNGLTQPYPDWEKYMQNISVMGVRNVKNRPNNTLYYKPTQFNVGEGLYPLPRLVYVLNYQGTAGLGMGFASFVAGETGQRIVLKSGLVPIRIPERNIVIRKEITETKN